MRSSGTKKARPIGRAFPKSLCRDSVDAARDPVADLHVDGLVRHDRHGDVLVGAEHHEATHDLVGERVVEVAGATGEAGWRDGRSRPPLRGVCHAM